MFKKLHEQIVIAASQIKDRIGECNDAPGHMTFQMIVSGRVNGDLKLEYKLGEYGGDVKGASLAAVLEEYLRRNGWEKRNDPVAIPYMKKVIGESIEYVAVEPSNVD